MKPRPLPCITDQPKQEFLLGWWAGVAVGLVTGLAVAVMVWSALRGM